MSPEEFTPRPEPADPLAPTPRDTLRARFMFVLAFVYLLLVAGLIHRATSTSVVQIELDVMYVGLVALWPVFVAEAVWGASRRDPARPRRSVWLRVLLIALAPPWRMALPDPRTGLVWVPRLGWQPPGKELFKRLDRAFAAPMIAFAFLILPILVLEYLRGEHVRETVALALALDVGIAVVWMAFATEFVFKASVHSRPFEFARERWLDVAIVVLPMLEFVLTRWVDVAPLARLLRLGRALAPEQISRMQRLYRLQGLATRAWYAFLLLGGLGRLFGVTPEARLRELEGQIADLEEQLKEARREAEELRELIAVKEAKEAKPTHPVDPPAPVP